MCKTFWQNTNRVINREQIYLARIETETLPQRPLLAGVVFSCRRFVRSASLLGEDGIEHLHHELLLGARQLADALHVLCQFRRRAAFGRL